MTVDEILKKVNGINKVVLYEYSFKNYEEIKVRSIEVVVSHIIFAPNGEVNEISFLNHESLNTIYYSDFDKLYEDSWYFSMYSDKNDEETLIEFKKLLIEELKSPEIKWKYIDNLDELDLSKIRKYPINSKEIVKKLEGELNESSNSIKE